MFSTGDLITGLDRNYIRSIYKVCSVKKNGRSMLIRMDSFNGTLADDSCKAFPEDPRKYRLASKEEIEESRNRRYLGDSLPEYVRKARRCNAEKFVEDLA